LVALERPCWGFFEEHDMTDPQAKPRRARRVIRLHQLPDYLGNKTTQNEELVRLGLLHPFALSPGGRSKVVTEDEVVELQEHAQVAGSLEALIANAKRTKAVA
jgi:hypothetical protein